MLLLPQLAAHLRLLPGLKSGGWGIRPGQPFASVDLRSPGVSLILLPQVRAAPSSRSAATLTSSDGTAAQNKPALALQSMAPRRSDFS